MAENCNNNCASCGSDCPSRRTPQSFLKAPHEGSHIKKVIAVVSGKGGVGKSLVTGLLASAMRRRGRNVAVLDADVTGPSVPAEFGIYERAVGDGKAIFPSQTSTGIDIMSMNLLLDHASDPVVWRGPVIAGVVTQFWTDVIWGDVDYMFVDMPPGTGDVPLTIFQSLPVDGIVVVTTPQEMVGVIVEKAVKMAHMMNKPVLALVENMSYFVCDSCGKKHRLFGESRLQETAGAYNIPLTAQLPIDPAWTALVDAGRIEDISCPAADELALALDAE